MNEIIVLDQGSAQWHAYRMRYRNASETPTVMGLSPWQTPYQLWLLRTGRKLAAETEAMRHGKAMEASARAAYEAVRGTVMEPQVLVNGAYSASLDGMALDGSLIVEIKCPFRGRRSELWESAQAGRVPVHYYLQIQHQLMVSAAPLAHLFVFDGEKGVTVEVKPEPEMWDDIRHAWDTFMQYVHEDRHPPLKDDEGMFRDDEPWWQAAKRYVTCKQAADDADAALAKAREALLALQSYSREEGGGVLVTRYKRAGTIDYKKIPELEAVDLEQYRGPEREEVRITLV